MKSVGAEPAQICSPSFHHSSDCTVFPSGSIKTALCAGELAFLSFGVKLTAVSRGPVQVITQNTQPEAVGKYRHRAVHEHVKLLTLKHAIYFGQRKTVIGLKINDRPMDKKM